MCQDRGTTLSVVLRILYLLTFEECEGYDTGAVGKHIGWIWCSEREAEATSKQELYARGGKEGCSRNVKVVGGELAKRCMARDEEGL